MGLVVLSMESPKKAEFCMSSVQLILFGLLQPMTQL